MISMTFDTKTVEAAMVAHLRDNLGIKTENKSFEISFVVGRKTAEKPKPDVTATINIIDIETGVTEETVEVSEPVTETPDTPVTEAVQEPVAPVEKEEVAETFDEEEVSMPPETKPFDSEIGAEVADDEEAKGEEGLFD